MFDTIVWATDGSTYADSTLPLVTELSTAHGSRIVALHVNQLFRDNRFGGGPVLAGEEELRSKIEEQVADLRAGGFEAQLEIVTSQRHDVAALIAETAARAGADLIVVGTHGRTETGELLYSSIAKGLTHVATCPILTIPTTRADGPGARAAAGKHALTGT